MHAPCCRTFLMRNESSVSNEISMMNQSQAVGNTLQQDNKEIRDYYELGLKYLKGDEVEQNITKAMQLLNKAAEEHNLKAQLQMASLYFE
jgi:TPR repeat protein